MIEVLVVDDDPRKRTRIASVLNDALGQDNVHYRYATSAAAGATQLEENDFDLLILDVNLPLRNGEAAKRDAKLSG